MTQIMTCSEVAQLIYRFAEHKPSFKEGRAFRKHLLRCSKCREFLNNIGKRFHSGDFDVGCHEIPDQILDLLSHAVGQKNSVSEEGLAESPGRKIV